MQPKQITPEELTLFKQYVQQITLITYPAKPTEKGPCVNPFTSAPEYKSYPTPKNIHASLKGGSDQREKSNFNGYSGDVLKSDNLIREGKGIQTFTNGTVSDGYFL